VKKISIYTVLACLMIGFILTPIQAEGAPEQSKPKVELTEKQKEELCELHEDMLETKKKIIKKYIEYGVFTEEKGNKIIEKMETRFKELKENGYVPNWDQHHHHH
jgi:hypothetical protein